MQKGKIIIISGPSGVGKKTILDQVMANKEALNVHYSISMTTRPMRPGEVNGKDYYFVSDEQFVNAINNGDLIEWAVFCGNKYGTPRSFLLNQINEGKNVILEIEVVGALNVLNQFNNDELLSIFIVPPSIEELKQRLINRGSESIDVINNRVNRAIEEIKVQDKYQHVVVNDNVDSAVNQIQNLIKSNTTQIN